MTEPEKKYTLAESFFMVIGLSVGTIGMIAIGFLISLLSAYQTSMMWGWFAVPYLHLPPIGTWLMFAIGLIAASFRPSNTRALKSELYHGSLAADYGVALLGRAIGWGVAYWVHLHILTGVAQ